MHQIKAVIDLIKAEFMGDHRVYFDLAIHIPIHDFRHIRPTRRPAKRRAAPHPARDQLERPRTDLGTRRRHPDDDAFAPSLMGRLKGCAHHRHIAGGVKGVICATTGQLDKMGDQITLYLGWVDKIGHAKPLAHLDLASVQVNPNDLISPRKA